MLSRRITRRRLLGGMGGMALAGTLGACGDGGDEGRAPPNTATNAAAPSPSPTATSAPAPSPTAEGPEATATPPDGVPLEVAVGEMLLLGFRGTELAAGNPIIADLQERHVGGVVLFDYDVTSDTPGRNIASPEQVRDLCAELQEVASTAPLLIAVDQEGGEVQRLNAGNGFEDFPSHAELGRSGDEAEARAVGARIGATLADAGISMNFAPCVDVNTNPDNPIIGQLGRSFSTDPGIVANMARSYIEGLTAEGIANCLKHFPGHGSSTNDSHEGFVDVTGTWSDAELEPYRSLLGDGIVDAVMVAHVYNGRLDRDVPASLSAATVDGLLRRELGFDGVVITDDLQMGAISGEYGMEEAVRLAINAGNDILAFGNNLDFEPELGAQVHSLVLRLVEQGDVDQASIFASYERVQRLKRTMA